MTNEQLKQKIENKSLDDSILVMVYKNNKYICNSYIDAICKMKNLEKQYIKSIYEVPDGNDFFDGEDKVLYVLDVEKLTENPTEDLKNLVILTKSVPQDLSVDYIEMVEPTNDHIISYVAMRLPGLNEDMIRWLCNICKYDIYRLDQECKKLEQFPVGSQSQMFMLMNEDNAYSDLSENNIFNFTNAILKRDLKTVGDLIKELDTADLEPLGCVTILLNKFRKMVDFLLNPKATPQSCGMTEKQFYYLKKHPDKYCEFKSEEVINNIIFLSNVDYQIKSGNLDMSREQLLAYITTKILC